MSEDERTRLGGPPGGSSGGPPGGGGYGQPPPQQGGYGQPPPAPGGYGAPPPPQQGGYGQPPPPQGGYGAPPPPPQPGGYGQPPPPQGGYGAPPPQRPGGYDAPPPAQPGYGPPPAGYGAPPPPQGGYGTPPPAYSPRAGGAAASVDFNALISSLRLGDILAVGGAVLYFFAKYFPNANLTVKGATGTVFSRSVTANGWEASRNIWDFLQVVFILLTIAAVVAIGLNLLPTLKASVGLIYAGLGGVLTLLALIAFLDAKSQVPSGFNISVGPHIGFILLLIFGLAIVAGGLMKQGIVPGDDAVSFGGPGGGLAANRGPQPFSSNYYGGQQPPQGGGYGAPPPPQQGGYGAPPPPPQGGYGAPPPPQGGYGAPPPPQGGYGQPPQQGGYGQPPPPGGYGPPPGGSGGYGGPPPPPPQR